MLFRNPISAYKFPKDTVRLSAELEQFATEAVAAGRYRDFDDVVRAGLSLLRDAEAELAAFVTPLEDAQAEGERDRFVGAEDMHRRMTAMLDEITNTKA